MCVRLRDTDVKTGTVLVSLHFCQNNSNDDNDDVDYENEDDHPAKKTGGRKTETRKGGRGFGKATTNSELDQSLLMVHIHFFTP